MKKYLLILVAAVIGLSMVGCKRMAETKAEVNVTVLSAMSQKIDGATVYAFTSYYWNSTDNHSKFEAFDHQITNAEGVANFKIPALFLSDKETFYFAVFDDNLGFVKASKAVEVRVGDEKSLTLNL